jgi:cytochrome o ubiquinol oxidase subunit II
VDRPVTFELTADESPMSSFWIPNLGGQLYSMTTHVNRLNLLAEVPGDYPGNSAEINGKGFAGMKFTARVSSELDFENWLQEVQESTEVLELDEYNELLKPSEKHPVTYYSAFKNNLFSYVVEKYNTGSHGAH